MAIDFSKVKTITIPEGSVTKITDSNGAVLWKAKTEGWHTIWKGSKTIKTSANKTILGDISNFASTSNGTGFTPHLRITFSFDRGDLHSSLDDFKYYNNSMTPQKQKPNSPIEIDSVKSNDNMIVLGRDQSTEFPFTLKVLLIKHNDISNNKINFSLSGNFSGKVPSLYASGYYVSMTITKIEQYY